MTKETRDRMCLLKRHNDKRTEGKMTEETRDAMVKDWKVREYLISFSLSNSLQRYSRNELFMYLCRQYSMLEWRCNLLVNNHNNTGYPLIYRLLSNNYSWVFYLLHRDRITFKNKSNYGRNSFTLQMVRIYVCLDAGVSTSSSRRKSIRAVYLHPFISSNSAQWLLRI